MELQKQQQEAAEKAAEKQHERMVEIQKLENEGNQEVAITRALGGLQSDNNNNGQTDAMENMLRLRIQQLNGDINNAAQKIAFEKEKHKDDMDLKRQEILSKESIAQKNLASSLVNQSKSDDKKLNKEIAKKQGVK